MSKDQILTDEERIEQILKLSNRHRAWGKDVPAVDLDYVIYCEYDGGTPRGLVEYSITPKDPKHPNSVSLMKLCNMAFLPFIYSQYNPETWQFLVSPGNQYASQLSYLPSKTWIDEKTWVRFLYELRGREVPAVWK